MNYSENYTIICISVCLTCIIAFDIIYIETNKYVCMYFICCERVEGGDVMNKELKNRVNNFLDELGVTAAAFCRRVGISYSAYQNWKRDIQKISQKTQEKISDYLAKYNF